MSHISATVTHNEYTGTPTDEKTFTDPDTFNAFSALKEGFFVPFKSQRLGTWVGFTLVGLVVSLGLIAGSSLTAQASANTNSGSAYAIAGDILALTAILVGTYFLIGMTQGFIRGTHYVAPQFNDLFVSNPRTIFRGLGATFLLVITAIIVSLPLLALNTLAIFVGVPITRTVSIAIVALSVVLALTLRIVFAYTIYAIIDSGMKVGDSFMLSFRIFSRNFFSSVVLFIATTLALIAPAALIVYLPSRVFDEISSTTSIALWIVALIVTVVIFPATQVAYVYAYRKSTQGPVPVKGSCETVEDTNFHESEETEAVDEETIVGEEQKQLDEKNTTAENAEALDTGSNDIIDKDNVETR